MGYLQIFGEKLEELMRTRGLGEAQREEIAAYVKETVLQSFRNGVEKGRAEKGAPRNAKPTRRPAKRTR
jgi:hypothetical protein